jgi:ABC-type antimicrobial peptide transport system permease subunit
VSAFAFVSRVVEYRVVTGEISRIETHFRSIGFLQHLDFETNTYPAAEIIAQSPYIHFEDRRQIVQGELPVGMKNAEYNWGNVTITEVIRGTHDVYFYGVLRNMFRSQTMYGPAVNLRVDVDYVMAGFPEHLLPGQSIRLTYQIPDETANPFEDIEIGQRYFLRGEYFRFFTSPPPTRETVELFTGLPFNSDELWYIPIPESERLDLTDPTLADLAEEIETHIINQRTMLVTGTVDMTAMPMYQPETDYRMVYDGRFIDHEDYLNANHVTVVHRDFAAYNGLEIGDTLTLTIRDMQQFPIPMGYPAWREHSTCEIELTIVGTYSFTPRFAGINTTIPNPWMYIPQSVIPPGFGGDEAELEMSNYSFVLDSPRNESAFIEETKAALSAIGFDIVFFEHNAEVFFASADPIAQSVTVNLALFSLVSLLALLLAGFIYLRQNRRNFAIMRALGVPHKKSLKQKVVTSALLWVPIIIIGSVVAWDFALTQAENTLTALVEIEDYVVGLTAPPLSLLIALCAALSFAATGFIFIGGLRTVRRPVLELIQGQKQARSARISAMEEPHFSPTQSPVQESTNLPQMRSEGTAKQSSVYNSAKFVLRHIVRSPIKSVLTVIAALFFVIALGWLQFTIERTEAEVEQLRQTVPIYAEITRADLLFPIDEAMMHNIITRQTLYAVLGNEFIQEVYITGGFPWITLVSPNEYGEFSIETLEAIWAIPHDTEEDDWDHRLDWILAVNCLETFADNSSIVFAMAVVGMGEPFNLKFAQGFDKSHFIFDENETLNVPIPVIVHEDILEKRGLELGDMAFMAYSNPPIVHLVHIIGGYRGNTAGGVFHRSTHPYVLMPLTGLEFIRGEDTGYIEVIMRLDPSRNHEIELFQEQVDGRLRRNHIAAINRNIPLTTNILDSEFRAIVIPMEQNLSLLRILYPIAIAAAIVLGAGLSLLLMFQNAKNAAIMRVLGSTKLRTRTVLCIEQLIVTLVGIALAFVATPLMGVGLEILPLAGLYLGACVVGGIIGAVVVSRRPPLTLLQVKE